MPVTRDQVRHVARLARLELDAGDLERLERDLAQIVGYVDEVLSVNTEGVPPTASVAVEAAPLRADQTAPGLGRQAALAEAPRSAEGAFAVPAFVDES